MATRSIYLFRHLQAHLADLEITRSKSEVLFSNRQLSVSDIDKLYMGLYLSLFTEFESTIEKLFLGLLSGKYYSRHYTIQRLLSVKPVSMTQAVVFNHRSYADWLPYNEYTNPRARQYFQDGIPFTTLNPMQYQNLSDYCVIRNAIAHNSDVAHSRFQSMIAHLPLLPQERTPAGFLRSKPSATSPQTQFEIASLELEGIAQLLCL